MLSVARDVVGRVREYALLQCLQGQRDDHYSDGHNKTTQDYHARLTSLLMFCSTCCESTLAQGFSSLEGRVRAWADVVCRRTGQPARGSMCHCDVVRNTRMAARVMR